MYFTFSVNLSTCVFRAALSGLPDLDLPLDLDLRLAPDLWLLLDLELDLPLDLDLVLQRSAVIRAVKSLLIKGVLEYLQRYMVNNPLVLTYIILGL